MPGGRFWWHLFWCHENRPPGSPWLVLWFLETKVEPVHQTEAVPLEALNIRTDQADYFLLYQPQHGGIIQDDLLGPAQQFYAFGIALRLSPGSLQDPVRLSIPVAGQVGEPDLAAVEKG